MARMGVDGWQIDFDGGVGRDRDVLPFKIDCAWERAGSFDELADWVAYAEGFVDNGPASLHLCARLIIQRCDVIGMEIVSNFLGNPVLDIWVCGKFSEEESQSDGCSIIAGERENEEVADDLVFSENGSRCPRSFGP